MFQDETRVPEQDKLALAMTAVIEKNHGERRGEHRRRVLKAARIVFHRGLAVMDAIVRDLTPHGARLKLAETLRLPESCEIQFKDDKYRRGVQVVWRTASEAGIKFI